MGDMAEREPHRRETSARLELPKDGNNLPQHEKRHATTTSKPRLPARFLKREQLLATKKVANRKRDAQM